MSKGSNSQVTNSSSSTAPDSAAYANYINLINRATQVSNKPFQAYGGEETAPINAQQQAGFGNINANVAGYDPSQVWSDIGQGSTAVDANDIAAYNDPYTNSVVNATQADFDTQNQRANSIVTGNAGAQGALGGDRVGVAQALTQEGQNRVQAPQIAALRSAGFQNAVTNANAQKTRQLAGGQEAAQIGAQDINAQVGAGTMEQQTAQAGDTQKMTDYYRSQGYDFQTAQWLASILLPTGSQMGSSSTGYSNTQGPQPNQFMQAAGLGVSAAAAFARDGGRIEGFAMGGSPWSEGGASWVPDVKVAGQALQAAPLPKVPDMLSKPKDDSSKIGAGLGKIGKSLYDDYGASQQGNTGLETDAADNSSGIYTGPASQPGFAGSVDSWSGAGGYWARGGGVGRRGYAEGGVPISTGFGGGAFDDDLSPNDAVNERFANPMLGSDQYRNIGAHSDALAAEGRQRAGQPDMAVADAPLMPRPVKTSSFQRPAPGVARNDIVPKAMEAFKNIKSGVAPPRALGYSDEGPSLDDGSSDATDFSARRRTAIAPGVAAAPSSEKNIFGLPKISDEARQGLISMGLNMMANQRGGKGSALSSIGEGGIAGMTTYASAKAATAARDALARKEAFEREKFGSTETHQRAQEQHQKDQLEELRLYHQQSAQVPKPYTDDNGDSHMVFSRVNKDTRQLEHFDRNMSKGTTVRISPDDVTAPAPSPAPTTPVPATPGPTASIPPTTTTDGTDPAKAEPYDYRRGAPPIEKGADVPDPRPVSGKSVDSLKVDAEKYALTGVLPPAPRGGSSPTAITTMNYRNAVQNYANALALSRGITPAQMAEMHRSAPGMLRFVLGADGRATVSLGTAVRHLDTIQELAKVWNANDTQGINRISAYLSKQFGKEAGTTLEAAAHIVGPEIIKALGIAGAGTAEEREGAAKMFSTASSPAQVKAAVDAVQKLLGGQLDGKRRQAHAAGVSETMFKELIGDRPYDILSHAETVAPPPAAMSLQDKAALDWANANPQDKRAAAIKQRLGVK